MKKLIIIMCSCLLFGCSKSKNVNPEDCQMEKDQLIVQLNNTQNKLNNLKFNYESEVNKQVAAKKLELNNKIESYNVYKQQLIVENESYRARLRIVVLFAFAGVVLSMIVVNVVLYRRQKQKTGKKIYEE
ncbi:MAG: hypothetical protein K2Y14_01105 [Burkholderiales bacterium]|nr:hypothetical protein [Burkholderiales bacterium]